VRTLVVVGSEPVIEVLVESFKGGGFYGGKKLGANGLKESLDFASALGLVGFGVDEGDSKGGGDLMEELGAKGSSVVHIELSGKSPI
jgi:hypothetical protein